MNSLDELKQYWSRRMFRKEYADLTDKERAIVGEKVKAAIAQQQTQEEEW